ncbi:MAG: hypothetical protein QOK36_3464 [Gaiellales bacterium]|nr:hypothetical protein [Gaiellales bacterium]
MAARRTALWGRSAYYGEMPFEAWSGIGTATVQGVRLRAVAVARDELAEPPLVRVVLAEDLGIADVRVQGRKTKSPEARALVLPLAAFELDPPLG